MPASLSWFFAFRIIQTRPMLLSIIHGLNPNQKLKAILEGCANLDHFWVSTLESHQLFSQDFFLPNCVYLRFTHITNFQPKFYIGSALHHVLDREYSRTRKYYQLTHDRLVQAELALRFWREHQNLFVWAPIPLFACRSDFRCLELSLIQEWQPRLPFHLPIVSSEKGSSETTRDEHQCPVWVKYPVATRTPPLHAQDYQEHPGFRSVSTSPSTLAHHPRLGLQYQIQI